ncbi:MAG: hypothetical protein GX444_15925 [Myxococcales bacterium]|nr:hypothetical protein [Myxococcales bacterium]
MKRWLLILSVAALAGYLVLSGCGRDFNRFPSGSASSLTLTKVEPTAGSNDADIAIVLSGTNFSGTPRVLVGAVECTSVAVVTSSLLSAVIPAGTAAGLYDITVITEKLDQASLADAFTVINPNNLTVTAIDPNQGLDNVPVAVTITGTNFVAGATVSIGATSVESVSVVSGTTITGTVPLGITPGTYDVEVTNSGGGTAKLIAGYTVLNSKELQITSIDPNHGPTDLDTAVTIYGANFDDSMTVIVGPNLLEDVTTVASDILTATVPAGITPGVYSVRVINADDEYAELSEGYTVDSASDDDDDDDDDDDNDTSDDDNDTGTDDDDDNDTAK